MESKARKLASKMEKEMLQPDSESEEEFFKSKGNRKSDQSEEEEEQ